MTDLKIDRQEREAILTPEEVAELMPASVPKSWIYAHWEDLGGVKIGKRKFILSEVLYANLQGRQMVVRPDYGGQRKVDSQEREDGGEQVENQEGRQAGRDRAQKKGERVKNHSNEFGLVDAVQRVSQRRES